MGIGKQVGGRIKLLREARKLSQSQLAAMLGKTTQTISRMEGGKVHPSLQTIDQLARRLNVRPKDFFADEPIEPVRPTNSSAMIIVNAVDLIDGDDLTMLASIAELMLTRTRRRKSG